MASEALMPISSNSFTSKVDFDLEAEPLLHKHGIWGLCFPWAGKYFSLTSRSLVVVAGSRPARLEKVYCNIINHDSEQKRLFLTFNILLKNQMFSREICLTVHINESGTMPVIAIWPHKWRKLSNKQVLNVFLPSGITLESMAIFKQGCFQIVHMLFLTFFKQNLLAM